MPFELQRICADCGKLYHPQVRGDMSAGYYCPQCDTRKHVAQRTNKPPVAKPRGGPTDRIGQPPRR